MSFRPRQTTALLFAAVATLLPGYCAAGVTYSEHVAPIFIEHCVVCHSPGQIAPMSLRTYEEIAALGQVDPQGGDRNARCRPGTQTRPMGSGPTT